LFFYPKLAEAYKGLNLIDDATLGGGLTVFDIGANKGQSVSFFKNIFPNSKIIAFEPSEKTFNSLSSFVKNNSYLDVSIFQAGMGEVHGELYFYESVLDETSTFSLPNKNSQYLKDKNRILFQKSENAFRTVTARITTIDRFIEENQISYIDILKIDVEGFEKFALDGAIKTLQSNELNILILEINSSGLNYNITDDEIFNFVIENGFKPYIYNHLKKELIEINKPNKESFNTIFIKNIDFTRNRLKLSKNIKIRSNFY
jgi:FkbM family methyltransferase